MLMKCHKCCVNWFVRRSFMCKTVIICCLRINNATVNDLAYILCTPTNGFMSIICFKNWWNGKLKASIGCTGEIAASVLLKLFIIAMKYVTPLHPNSRIQDSCICINDSTSQGLWLYIVCGCFRQRIYFVPSPFYY